MSDQPEEKKTVELAAVPPWAVELTREVKGARADISLVSNDLSIVKDRVGIIESWKNDMDSRANRTSNRVQQASESGLETEAKVAEMIVWRKSVDTALAQTATKDDLARATTDQTAAIVEGVNKAFKATIDEIAKNPMVKKIGYAAGVLVLQALAAATTYLALKGH